MTDPLDAATVPRISPMFRLQWEEAQGCHVLLYPEGMVTLSGSAGEILKRIDGSATIGAIIEGLKQAFPGVPLEQDVYKFLEIAYGNGWLRSVQSN